MRGEMRGERERRESGVTEQERDLVEGEALLLERGVRPRGLAPVPAAALPRGRRVLRERGKKRDTLKT